jgi:enoyl-CoA hydratase/carnithine racemase
MSYEQIGYEIEDGILTLTLDRPEKLNAFTTIMLKELLDAFDRADNDDTIKVIIVTGTGRGFCAGADLSMGANTFDADSRNDRPSGLNRDGGGILSLRIYDCLKPVIAAVNGPAVGVGVTMQLPMDIRIASEAARFGFVFARRGIVPEACSSWFLPRIVGISKALEWSYSGRVFSATEALEGGLVSEIVEPENLLARAKDIARDISTKTSSVSMAMIRQMMWKMLGTDHPMEAHKIDSRGIYSLGTSSDAREGVVSFLEKRPAQFSDTVSKNMPEFYPWWEEKTFK